MLWLSLGKRAIRNWKMTSSQESTSIQKMQPNYLDQSLPDSKNPAPSDTNSDSKQSKESTPQIMEPSLELSLKYLDGLSLEQRLSNVVGFLSILASMRCKEEPSASFLKTVLFTMPSHTTLSISIELMPYSAKLSVGFH